MTATLTYEQLLAAILSRVQDIEPAKRSKFAQEAYDACSFLQACGQSRLKSHLGVHPAIALHTARRALLAIGVTSGANALIPKLAPTQPLRLEELDRQARRIEEAIAERQDSIFAELTRYAAFGCMVDPDFFRGPQ